MHRIPGPPGSRPLPPAVVSELLDAGLSRGTVQSMERWKALEVLDLLRSVQAREQARWAGSMGTDPRSNATI